MSKSEAHLIHTVMVTPPQNRPFSPCIKNLAITYLSLTFPSITNSYYMASQLNDMRWQIAVRDVFIFESNNLTAD